MKTFLTVILITVSFSLFAQDQLQLAMNYYNDGEYQKAAVLFKKLYNKRKSKFYFDYYVNCLVNEKDYNTALSEINKQIRRNPGDLTFLVNKIQVLALQGKNDQAEKTFEQLLKKLPANAAIIKQLAYEFIKIKDYDHALKLLDKGKKITGQQFFNEYYVIYASQRNYDKMTDVLLDWVAADSRQYAKVQRIFMSYMNSDVNDEFSGLLFKKLIARLQQKPLPAYYRLIIWYFTEKKMFDMAITQAIAYDKRMHGLGAKVYEVGMVALDNDSLDAAQKAFEYISGKGRTNPYYFKAKQALLNVLYGKVTAGKISTMEQIQDLEQKYVSAIDEMGLNSETAGLLAQLAHLEAFYLNKEDKALEYLDQALSLPSLSPQVQGQLLIEKALVYLRQNKPYAALLLLARAYDKNKDNPTGDKAKFLQAQIYYFLGQIQWAKSQFDILKGATDKLTSNDAILYSFIIQQASDDSTNMEVLRTFAKAQYYAFVNKPDSAFILFDSIVNNSYFLADRALYEEYKIHYSRHEYEKAARDLEKLVSSFSSSLLIDRAIYLLGLLYEEKLNDPQKAAEYFRQILFDYKGSIYTGPAREHYRKIVGE